MDLVRGVLSSQDIRERIQSGLFGEAYTQEVEKNIQPAGYDPQFEEYCFRVPSGFKPPLGMTVEQALQKIPTKDKKKYDISKGFEVQPGFSWLLPLRGTYTIPESLWLQSSPKSTQGRIGTIVKLISDSSPEYDEVWGPFTGKLYVLVEPTLFRMILHPNIPLLQLRLYNGMSIPRLTTEELSRETIKHNMIVLNGTPVILQASKLINGVPLTIDLKGEYTNGIIGYKSRHTPESIDLSKKGEIDIEEYFDPVHAPEDGVLRMNPTEKLHLLSSREFIRIPPHLSAVLLSHKLQFEEQQFQEEGFFDPGFGYGERGEQGGATATIEVHSKTGGTIHLRHGQEIGTLSFEWMTQVPDKIYGEHMGSTYHRQAGPRYSNIFKIPEQYMQPTRQLQTTRMIALPTYLIRENYHQGYKPKDERTQRLIQEHYTVITPQDIHNNKQIETCTVLINPTTRKFFAYKNKQGQWSICIRAPATEEDLKYEQPYKTLAQKTIAKTIKTTGEVSINHIGYINDDRDETGQQRYGLLHTAEINNDEVQTTTELKGEGAMITLNDLQLILQDKKNTLEGWSQIAFSAIKGLVV